MSGGASRGRELTRPSTALTNPLDATSSQERASWYFVGESLHSASDSPVCSFECDALTGGTTCGPPALDLFILVYMGVVHHGGDATTRCIECCAMLVSATLS